MRKRLIFLLSLLGVLIIVLVLSLIFFRGETVKSENLNVPVATGVQVKDLVDKPAATQAPEYVFVEGDCLAGLNKQIANFSNTKYNYGGINFFQPDGYELKSTTPLKLSKGTSEISISVLKYSELEDLIKDLLSENDFKTIEYSKIGESYQLCSTKGSTKYLYYLLPLNDNIVSISYVADVKSFESDLYGYLIIKDSISFYT